MSYFDTSRIAYDVNVYNLIALDYPCEYYDCSVTNAKAIKSSEKAFFGEFGIFILPFSKST